MSALEDALPLADAMRDAACDLAIGQPKMRVAMAITMACAAIVQACAEPGQEVNALRASAAHLQKLADAKSKMS